MKLRLAIAAALLVASSAHAGIVNFKASLSGLNEAPPNASPAVGLTDISYDSATHLLSIHIIFADLIGTTTAAHIHCCTAVAGAGNVGVATEVPSFDFVALGVHSGDFFGIEDLSSAADFNPAFLAAHGGTPAGAEAFLIAGMLSGKSYLNVHSTFRGGGEIRGFLAIPEPTPYALAMLALGGLAFTRRSGARRQ